MKLVREVIASSGPDDEEDDDELVVRLENYYYYKDPLDTLKEECRSKKECEKYLDKLNDCTTRVTSRTKTTESCHEEMIDFVTCVDHCVSKTLFSKLK